MTDGLNTLSSPDRIVETAEKLYAERFKEELERSSPGWFAVIDVLGQQVYVNQFAEKALEQARREAPNGLFHLIRIGSSGAFRVSYASHNDQHWGWPLRQAG